MRLLGHVWKSKNSRFWLVEVPDLDLTTQGETRGEALQMIEDAIAQLVNAKGFKVCIDLYSDSNFTVDASEPSLLMSLLLRRQREAAGLTVREASHRLGSSSPNAYAQYERGERSPSVEQLDALLRALNTSKHFIIGTSEHEFEKRRIGKK